MRMRFLMFGQGPLYARCFAWLRARGELPVAEIAGPWSALEYATHPTAAQASFGLAIGYRHLLGADLLAVLPVLNLHHGLLPYNRGADPNVWAILDGTPSGTTLHWMDAGLDTGPILAQLAVKDDFGDTAQTLYAKLQDASFALFCQNWEQASAAGEWPAGVPQVGAATVHRRRDLTALDAHPLDRRTLDILRARTFPPYAGQRYQDNGKTYDLQLIIREVPDAPTDH